MIEKIEDVVLEEFNVSLGCVKSKDQCMEYVHPRHLIWWFALHYTNMSIPRIAERYNRERTTLYNGIDNVTNRRKTDANYRIRFEKLKNLINN